MRSEPAVRILLYEDALFPYVVQRKTRRGKWKTVAELWSLSDAIAFAKGDPLPEKPVNVIWESDTP